MAQNLVIPNKDNKVTFIFNGIDLTLSNDIKVVFGVETYSVLTTPTKVIVVSATELSLDLSETLEVGKIFATITYFDGASVNGTDITSRELANVDKIVVSIGTQLIIEDGSIVSDANSFATDDEFKRYAGLRNIDIPATQPDREALLVLAMDYIFSVETKMKGLRVSELQDLPYPRDGACENNRIISSNEIPKSLKNAQMELAAQANVSDLLVNESTNNVSKEKLGDLEAEYFSGGSWSIIRTDRADAYLNQLLMFVSNNIMQRVY